MIAASYGNVSDIEIMWTLLAAIGIVFGLYNLRDALGDLSALNTAGIRNGRRLIAQFAIRQEILRLTMQSIYFGIGILAFTIPDPPPRPLTTKVAVIGFLITWGLVTSSAIVLFKSIDGYVTRKRLTGD